ncbi:MAG: WD40/YVTN/BNR-like repeat-containing protein [Bacteroidota bacterium]
MKRKYTSMRQLFIVVLLLLLTLAPGRAQKIASEYYQALKYRCIGPFRASRTVGATGIPTQPNVFFMGVNNGGVWKTDDYGRTWQPIFDSAPTGSVGDIAVSPSQPDVIYVGSGEGLHRPDLGVGDGIFKSMDGGKTWQHVGLPDVQQVGRVIVHPTNPDLVFVAGLGHPYGPNEERGVFRSRDGGKNWEKVLYVNHNTGAMQVEFHPTQTNILFATLWEHREGPWENASFSGSNSGLFQSTDGGTTWQKITQGLPTAQQGLGRIGFAISNSNPQRMYASVDAREKGGIYRSDDGGLNWYLVTADRRIWGRGSDFAEVKVHPTNPDVVFSANIAAYRSDDGGKTWMSIKGAPGGDDYHRIWINPLQPNIMLFAADQGAVITVNGGRTWSSWYNQPTAQLYHVTTDNQFPYWVYGGQQESGAIGIASRGAGGQISFRDWMGVGADEYAYVAPDPKNPDIVYGGRVTRFNKRTGQTQNVAPEALRSGQYRLLRTLPLMFHPADPDALLFATNVLWKTTTGGQRWEVISPDLTRKENDVPESIGDFRTEEMKTMGQRAVIYALAPSPLDKNLIWAGTDDGLVHVTQDGGKTWKNVTPAGLRQWDKIAQVDAGHFDKNTAYIAVNAIRKDDMKPHIYRTHDGGATWQEITQGMAAMGPVNVVREDPMQRNLLYAGTEREVYFSVDDGANWQSLRNNMPASSVRDLVIHENDLVVGTHGRSIWIMDDISPLRSLAALNGREPFLFPPALATRVRHNHFLDTPLPPEEPTGSNPPDGAVIDYWLPAPAAQVQVDIVSETGDVIRTYRSTDSPEQIDTTALPHPTYWIRKPQTLGIARGHHRITWDMRYAPPRGAQRQFAIAAVYRNTPSGPEGPWAMPGNYKVRLTVDGQVMEQTLILRLDPRLRITQGDLQQQAELSLTCYQHYHTLQQLREMIDQKLQDTKKRWPKGRREALLAYRGSGAPENPDIMYGGILDTPADKETLVGLQDKFLHVMALLQSADAPPTEAMQKAIVTLTERLEALRQRGVLLLK